MLTTLNNLYWHDTPPTFRILEVEPTGKNGPKRGRTVMKREYNALNQFCEARARNHRSRAAPAFISREGIIMGTGAQRSC